MHFIAPQTCLYHTMPRLAMWAMLATFRAMAVITLQHILDCVTQEHWEQGGDATGWKGMDTVGLDSLEYRAINRDCSWSVLTLKSIMARIAWRRGIIIIASMPLTTSSSLLPPPNSCLYMCSWLESHWLQDPSSHIISLQFYHWPWGSFLQLFFHSTKY